MHRTGIVLRSSIAAAGIFSPDNLQERLIGRLSGAKNDTVAQQSAAACLQRFGEHGHIEKKTGMFVKYHSGRDCTVKETKDTPSDFAARVIEANCYLLYWPGEGNRKTAMVIDQALLARVRLEHWRCGERIVRRVSIGSIECCGASNRNGSGSRHVDIHDYDHGLAAA